MKEGVAPGSRKTDDDSWSTIVRRMRVVKFFSHSEVRYMTAVCRLCGAPAMTALSTLVPEVHSLCASSIPPVSGCWVYGILQYTDTLRFDNWQAGKGGAVWSNAVATVLFVAYFDILFSRPASSGCAPPVCVSD